MPVKDQTKCFRTFGGIKYMNLCDVLDEQHFELVKLAKAMPIRHRLIKHPSGYGQLFVHPDDVSFLYQKADQG